MYFLEDKMVHLLSRFQVDEHKDQGRREDPDEEALESASDGHRIQIKAQKKEFIGVEHNFKKVLPLTGTLRKRRSNLKLR